MSPALEEHKVTKALLITFALGLATAMGVGQKPVEDLEGKLLETGTFHGEEVSARSGERWLGLHVTADTSTLLSYIIKVKAVHDEIVENLAQAHRIDPHRGADAQIDAAEHCNFLQVWDTGIGDCGPLDDVWTLDLAKVTAWTNSYNALVGETCARLAKPDQVCPNDCGRPLSPSD